MRELISLIKLKTTQKFTAIYSTTITVHTQPLKCLNSKTPILLGSNHTTKEGNSHFKLRKDQEFIGIKSNELNDIPNSETQLKNLLWCFFQEIAPYFDLNSN